MRSEQEMLGLIVTFIREDENIRAAVLNGSRADPNVTKDFFQDFDVLCFVRSVEPYVKNRDFIRRFGKIMIMQVPEEMGDPPPRNDGSYVYLMQFADGNRIDLGFCSVDDIGRASEDSLTVLLIDKDGLIGELPPSSDKDYLPAEPTKKQYEDCCNEFWWVCPYAAKGLWRGDLLYARFLMDSVIRKQLMKMMTWYFGIVTGFKKSPGKLGKNIKYHIDPPVWTMLKDTFSDSDTANVWEALLTMCRLFRMTAQQVADTFGFGYPESEDLNVSKHLEHIRSLPKTATEMY